MHNTIDKLPRIGKFAFAVALGFVVTEGVLTAGIFALYRSPTAPRGSSPLAILGLDIASFVCGVTVAFLLNERLTVAGQRQGGMAFRWARYQGTSLLGNAVIIVVQLALFTEFSLSPILGNVAGAVLSYPLTYAVSMRFVWRRGQDTNT